MIYLTPTAMFPRCRRLILGRKKVSHVPCEKEDEDVAAEHLRVSSGAAGSDVLQVTQLSKVYQHLNKNVYAVKKVSVGIPAGEVSPRKFNKVPSKSARCQSLLHTIRSVLLHRTVEGFL